MDFPYQTHTRWQGAGKSLLCGLPVPPHSLGSVQGDAPAYGVHVAEVGLGGGIALLRKWFPLPQGRRVVALLVGFIAPLELLIRTVRPEL